MIQNNEDLIFYLREDKRALGMSAKIRPRLVGDDIWKFEIILRKYEYYKNTNKKNIYHNVMMFIYKYLHYRIGVKLGFSIPVNTFGYGLRINHHGLLVVNADARIGNNCDVHQGVNIGQGSRKDDVPRLGDNIWIGPGAKIFGKINIADNISIGANSIVNKSFEEKDITIAGVPAKKIKDKGTSEMESAKDFK